MDFHWDTRDIVVMSNESTANECREAHQQVFLVDITDELYPIEISNYKVGSPRATSARVEAGSALTRPTRT